MSLDQALNGAVDWTEAGPLAEMTPADRDRREALVATVWRHLDGFMEAGAALVEIRDSRLYRDTHPTFAAFCKDEFSLSRSGAYELMTAAEVVSGIPDTAPRPQNIGQANALAAADPAERADVMAAVAGKGKPTAAAITDEIESRKPPAPSPAGVPVETGRVPSAAPPASSPAAQVEPEVETDRCGACGDVKPDVTGGWCADCWMEHHREPDEKPAEPITIAVEISAAAPKPKAEKPPSEKVWRPVKSIDGGIKDMLPAREVMGLVPADSVKEIDLLADEAIAWGKRWHQERKAATRLRLMGVK